ncbi:MAG: hypothetical protein OES79_10380, partial [Planctomycetota bacterium]|nr:hypothetical protein [Planctomycetota bacterium]
MQRGFLLLAVLIASGCAEAIPNESARADRDPALWPFASDSPWNHPLGSDAQYAHIDSPGVDNRGSATINVTAWSHPV